MFWFFNLRLKLGKFYNGWFYVAYHPKRFGIGFYHKNNYGLPNSYFKFLWFECGFSKVPY